MSEKNNEPQAPQNPARQPFLERFIDKYFRKMHPVVQNFVFLLFAITLIYSIWQATAGVTLVPGRLFVKLCPPERSGQLWISALDGGCEPAAQTRSGPDRTHDVVYGAKRFAVNLNGDYSMELGRVDYVKLLARGQIDIWLYNSDASFHELHRVAFNRLSGDLTTLTLPSPETLASAVRSPAVHPYGWFAPTQVYAQVPSPGTGKALLFLTAVRLSSGAPSIKEAKWQMNQAGFNSPLVLGDTGTVASTPVLAGQTIDLGRKYFFSLPLAPNQSHISGAITLRADMGFFQATYTETFRFDAEAQFDSRFNLNGDRGSALELSLSAPVDMTNTSKAKSIEPSVCAGVEDNDTCHRKYPAGCSSAGKFDAYFNFLKNQLPSPSQEPLTLLSRTDYSILDQQSPLATRGNHADHADLLASLGEGRVAATAGYLYRVARGGRESTNCQLSDAASTDLMLHIGFDPMDKEGAVGGRAAEQGSVVAEITPHYRAKYRPGWTYEKLRQLVGRPIKVVGLLMMDTEHAIPADNCGHPNADRSRCWRASAWEIHPVTQLYACKPAVDCAANPNSWERIE